MQWHWDQMNHMTIICTSLQTDNHASTTTSLKFFTNQMLFLMPNQQCQSAEHSQEQVEEKLMGLTNPISPENGC